MINFKNMTQLESTEHQTLPLVKSDDEPAVQPDRPIELIKTTPHHNFFNVKKEQVYPSRKSDGLQSRTEVYIGQRYADAASGFDKNSES